MGPSGIMVFHQSPKTNTIGFHLVVPSVVVFTKRNTNGGALMGAVSAIQSEECLGGQLQNSVNVLTTKPYIPKCVLYHS